ncbi:MAG: ABC-F family ATP-binding cassette domain-containing protein, partial [Gemmataceae bacterium]
MPVLLQITGAYKSYGEQILLDNAEASITDNVKVGFIGRNGAGKSTLLKILLGEEELDKGEVIRHPTLRLGYLRQHDPFLPDDTVMDYLQRDSEQPAWKCADIAGDFELKGTTVLDGPVKNLSGGWQTRVKLAALLLHEPNLLVLDEPTNFLDLRTQILLEHFLQSHRAGCLVVSHDRAFLGATCNHTLSLSRGKLTAFPGKVEGFLEFEKERRLQEERTNQSILSKRKHLEDFIARNKARAATAGLAQSKQKILDKMENVSVTTDEPTATIKPPRIEPRKGQALRCKDLVIGYPERQIARDIQLEIDHGTRSAIVGDNGQGKTTFLRTIVESLAPLGGEFRWGHGCKLGVYAQHVYSNLPEKNTVLEQLRRMAAQGKKEQEILDVAGSLLFRRQHLDKTVNILSGGERARLCLAGLLLSDFNVLILDEPGNHLDVDTVDALVDALTEYAGTVIFTSHDRHFTRRVATNIIEVREGRVVNHLGGYQSYLDRVNQEISAGERELANERAKAGLRGGAKAAPVGSVRSVDALRAERDRVQLKVDELTAKRDAISEAYSTASGDAF